MKRKINKVAVLGSGVMGARIACHFANIGVEVLLLDIVPRALDEKENAAGLTLNDAVVRNRIVNQALQDTLKARPAALYLNSSAQFIQTGNFEDDMPKIAQCDWVIEVVVERLDIKQLVFAQVEKFRKPGSLITTNTSGIPIHSLIEGRSEDFTAHFCGTHFFNPPRYLPLLEIIPSVHSHPEVIDFLLDYGGRFLGKETVLCKDTPAFIANRIGVFSIMDLFHLVEEEKLSPELVDKLTGPIIGHAKSATFRTCDVVGLDTLVHVANGVRENCPADERNSRFNIPAYITKMLEAGLLGSKSKAGFFKKEKSGEIVTLDFENMRYRTRASVSLPSLTQAKSIDDLKERLRFLFAAKDQAGDFYRKTFCSLFNYVAHRIPEISDELYRIDDAMRAGFGWQLGPFEYWEAIGFETVLTEMSKQKLELPAWVNQMKSKSVSTFYTIEKGHRSYYHVSTGAFEIIPGQEARISISQLPAENLIWKNSGSSIHDLGDGILNISFHSKMNTIGGEVIAGLNKAIDLAESNYRGLVISNEGENFSAGANVGMIFMMAAEQEYEELDVAIRTFQKTVGRMRFSSIPVVAAPHGLTLGGGCELCMHADKVIAHAESYIGLVEFGVGVIPGGGGTKEFALRCADEMKPGDIRINTFRERFLTIGQAKVSTSAAEAFDLGYLRKGIDEIAISRKHQLQQAKTACLSMAEKGYSQPAMRKDIEVLGNEGLGIVYVGAHSMMSGNYISEHDQLISEKLGFVLSGGDLSKPTLVSEQYLLDLERKAFLELCMQRKTLERMESLIKSGKILRN